MMTKQEQYRCIARCLPLLAGAARDDWRQAAHAAGWTPYYFQRVFKRHIGISPQQYTACLKLADVKQRLAAGERVLGAALDAGLSGGGRAHDLFVTIDGMTPGQFAGAALTIDYGCADSPFGRVFIAATPRGVCSLQFIADAVSDRPAVERCRRQWRHAELREQPQIARRHAEAIFSAAATPLHVRGTNFQVKVWQALLAIARGQVVSYSGLARALGAGGARAVGSAIGANPVALLIPCHRVLGKGGQLTGYAWGLETKRALLAAEWAARGE